MISLGFKRSELSDGYYGCAPCCAPEDPKEKEAYENEIVYPEVSFSGKQAEVLGVDDLELDQVVEVKLKLKVCGLRSDKRVVNGKQQRDLSLSFKVLEASDYEVEETEGEGESETEPEGSGSDDADVAALKSVMGQ